MTNPKCPDCGVAMDEGFLLDRGHHEYGKPSAWVEGAPEKSLWSGVKTRGKERHGVVSYRCARCGLLKQYAPGPT